jgi:hypothetical protein
LVKCDGCMINKALPASSCQDADSDASLRPYHRTVLVAGLCRDASFTCLVRSGQVPVSGFIVHQMYKASTHRIARKQLVAAHRGGP